MSDSDLCIVLGNSLKNAIYACIHMGKYENRFIDIKTRTIKKQILIQVKNSYIGGIEIRDGHYISSKSDMSHGFGIGNINRVVVSYGGFVKIEHNEREFTLMVAIPEK
jgi:sensor histidine kinase regulating citrate/malate metabolism